MWVRVCVCVSVCLHLCLSMMWCLAHIIILVL